MRSRIAHPGLFENTILGKGPELALPLFLGLTMMADRNGCFKWRPLVIVGTIFPHRKTNIEKLLSYLVSGGLIGRYEVDGEVYGYVINFSKYQKIHPHEKQSNIPVPTMSLHCIHHVNQEKPALFQYNSEVEVEVGSEVEVITKKGDPTLAVIPQYTSGSHFRCSYAEINALKAEDGPEAVATRIQVINDYCAANGKRYKSYAAAYRNFRKRDLEAAKGPKLHLHIHRQETNVDRMKSEGFFDGPRANGEVVGGSSIRIPGVSSAEGTRPKLVAKAPEVFRRGGEGSD